MSELSEKIKQAQNEKEVMSSTTSTGSLTSLGGMTFRRATKRQSRLRLAFNGPSGSGKTYSSLAIATTIGKNVGLIDTEHGSAAKFSDEFAFESLELPSFEPRTYVKAIEIAKEMGFDVLVIDSLSHAWAGRGGALEQVDMRVSRAGSSFTAWREVTPMHNELVEAMLSAPFHLIATMRSKTEYAIDKAENGKILVRKLGLAPVQRDGIEYEFDVSGDLDQDHNFHVTKTRCKALDDAIVNKPGAALANQLLDWLEQGEPSLSNDTRQAVSVYLSAAKETSPELFELMRDWRVAKRYASWTEFLAKGTEKEGLEILDIKLPPQEDKPDAPDQST